MSFLAYLVMGSLLYLAGFTLFKKIIRSKIPIHERKLSHPLIVQCLLACFVIMCVVSFLISRFVMNHVGFDVMYVLVNSLVGTVVFYFGLNPDEATMKLPD